MMLTLLIKRQTRDELAGKCSELASKLLFGAAVKLASQKATSEEQVLAISLSNLSRANKSFSSQGNGW